MIQKTLFEIETIQLELMKQMKDRIKGHDDTAPETHSLNIYAKETQKTECTTLHIIRQVVYICIYEHAPLFRRAKTTMGKG